MNLLYFNLFSSNLLSLGMPVIMDAIRRSQPTRIVNVDPYVTQADRRRLLNAGVPREQGDQPFIQHFNMEPFNHAGLSDAQREPMKELLEWADIVFFPREGGHPQDGLSHDVIGLLRGYSIHNKAFVLQHGLIHQDAIDNHVYFPFESDHLLVWSEHYKNFLRNQGMSEAHWRRTVALGCPKFDCLLRLDRSPQHILVTPNTHWDRYTEEDNVKFILSLSFICEAFPNERIVIKTHPAERHFDHLSRYDELIQAYNNVRLVVDNVSIPDLLLDAKLLIHTCSTVAIEAVIADIPVLTMNFTSMPTGMDEFDATYYVENVNEVCSATERALSVPEEKQSQRRELAIKHNGECDGHASERVTEFMLNTPSVTNTKRALYGAMYDEYWSNWHRDVESFTDAAFTERVVQVFQPTSVLDAGCGPGENLRKFLELGVMARGIELSRWMVNNKLQDLAEKGLVTQGSIVDLSCFEDHSFDIVFCIEVLEHLPPEEVEIALQELVRVCRGYIVCTIAFSPSAALDGPNAHIKREMFTNLHVHATIQLPEWWLCRFARLGVKHKPILSRALAHNEKRFENTQLYVFHI